MRNQNVMPAKAGIQGLKRWTPAFAGVTSLFVCHQAMAEGGLPQFDPSTYPSQLFWLALAFIVLFVFFKTKTLPDIAGVLENRRTHIQSNLDTAEKLKNEAAKARESYESLLENSRKDATRLLSEATAAVKAQADKELREFRERAAKDAQTMENRLTQGRKTALREMDALAAEIAAEAAARIAGIKTDLKQAQTVVQSLNKKEAA